MRNKIINDIKKIMRSWNIEDDEWNIHFGYDCIDIELFKEADISLSLIHSIKSVLSTDIIWVAVNENAHLVIGADISNIILKEFGDWESYENELSKI